MDAAAHVPCICVRGGLRSTGRFQSWPFSYEEVSGSHHTQRMEAEPWREAKDSESDSEEDTRTAAWAMEMAQRIRGPAVQPELGP